VCLSLTHTIGPFLLLSAVGVCCFFSLKKQSAENLFISFLSGCKSAVFLQPFNTQHFIIFIVVVYFIDRLGFLVPVFFICFFFFLSSFFFIIFVWFSVLIPCMSCCVFPVATAHFNGATDPFVCEYPKDFYFYLRTRFLYLSPLFIYSHARLIVKSFTSLHQN